MNRSSDQTEQPQDKWSARLANTKDAIDILRQLLIVSILLILIAWPTTFKNTLAALGIKKLGIAGAELEVTREISEKTGDAAQRLEEANEGFKSTQKNLDSLIRQLNNEEIKMKLEALNTELKKSLETTTNAEQNLNVSLAAQSFILQNATAEDVRAQGPWGIVISANKLVPDAQREMKKAQVLGYENVKIYSRQGWLRTVVELSSFAEGQAALPKLRSIRGSSYLVNMAKWCPNRKDAINGIWQCLE